MRNNNVSTGNAYFIDVNNDLIWIKDVHGTKIWAVGKVRDVEMFLLDDLFDRGIDTLYKSSSLDFAHEYATSDNTIDLAEQVNNAYFICVPRS
jgi:hypothetical protein